MGFFTGKRAIAQDVESRSQYWMDRVFRSREMVTSGNYVDEHTALTLSSVYRCVDLIADTISVFPIQRFKQGSKKKLTNESFLDNPSTDIDVVNWKRLLVVGWLLRGFTAGLITGSRNGKPTGLELIHPDRVGFRRERKDSPIIYTLDGQITKRWPRGPLWIADGKRMSPADPTGRSVLEFAAVEMGLGLSARKFGIDFFNSGGHPTALIHNDKKIEGLDEDGANRIKERFMRAVNGGREPVVLSDGWEYSPIQIRPDESQFLLTINANRLTVANFFGVPPEMIGATGTNGGGTIEYTNANDRNMDLLKFTIQPWVSRTEATIKSLLVRNEFIKLNVDALLRPDASTRYANHEKAVRTGWKNNAEIRDLEDMEEITEEDGGEGLEQFLWPPYRAQLSFPEMENDPDFPNDTDDPRWNPDAPPADTTAPGPKGKSKQEAPKAVDEEEEALKEDSPKTKKKAKRLSIVRDDNGRPQELVSEDIEVLE